jgi:hypothetical protein
MVEMAYFSKVDGRSICEWYLTHKNDLEMMRRCADAELARVRNPKTKKDERFAAPGYFKRVAILSRKQGDYDQEVKYCQLYLDTLEAYNKAMGFSGGDRLTKEFEQRIRKAQELIAKEGTKEGPS